jgi:predicted outer membrane repeat protein
VPTNTETPTSFVTETPTQFTTETPTSFVTETATGTSTETPTGTQDFSTLTPTSTIAPNFERVLLFTSNFDNWSQGLPAGWNVENSTLIAKEWAQPLYIFTTRDAELNLRFTLNAGGLQVNMRDTGTGGYGLLLRSDQQVGLFREGVLLQTAMMPPAVDASGWRSLAFSTLGNLITVSVDGMIVFTYTDAIPLTGENSAVYGIGTGAMGVLIDDLSVWKYVNPLATATPSAQPILPPDLLPAELQSSQLRSETMAMAQTAPQCFEVKLVQLIEKNRFPYEDKYAEFPDGWTVPVNLDCLLIVKLIGVNELPIRIRNGAIHEGQTLTGDIIIDASGNTFQPFEFINLNDSDGFSDGPLIRIFPGANVTIFDAVFTNTFAGGYGTILNEGNLTIISSSFIKNSGGSAIRSYDSFGTFSTLNVYNTVFDQNSGTFGGAISSSNAIINCSIFTGNSASFLGLSTGGAIYAGMDVSVTNSNFIGNRNNLTILDDIISYSVGTISANNNYWENGPNTNFNNQITTTLEAPIEIGKPPCEEQSINITSCSSYSNGNISLSDTIITVPTFPGVSNEADDMNAIADESGLIIHDGPIWNSMQLGYIPWGTSEEIDKRVELPNGEIWFRLKKTFGENENDAWINASGLFDDVGEPIYYIYGMDSDNDPCFQIALLQPTETITFTYDRRAAAQYAIAQGIQNSAFAIQQPEEFRQIAYRTTEESPFANFVYTLTFGPPGTTASGVFISEVLWIGGMPMVAVNENDCGSVEVANQPNLGWRYCSGASSFAWRVHEGVAEFFTNGAVPANIQQINDESSGSNTDGNSVLDDLNVVGQRLVLNPNSDLSSKNPTILASDVRISPEGTGFINLSSGATLGTPNFSGLSQFLWNRINTIQTGDYIWINPLLGDDHGFIVVGWTEATNCKLALEDPPTSYFSTFSQAIDNNVVSPVPYVVDFTRLQRVSPRPFFCGYYSDPLSDYTPENEEDNKFSDHDWFFYTTPNFINITLQQLYIVSNWSWANENGNFPYGG